MPRFWVGSGAEVVLGAESWRVRNSTRLQVDRMRASRMPGWWARVRVASARRVAGMARRSRTSMGAVVWLMPRRTSLGSVWLMGS